MARKLSQVNIFSRRFYEKITIGIFGPFYIFFLIGINFKWITLTQEPFPRYILLGSAPFILISLYLTSRMKIFPQRMGDCVQVIVWILILSSANTYWGGPMRVYGPLFITFILLIPFFALLLDSFLPYFIGGTLSILLILDFLFLEPISSLSIFQLISIVPTIFVIAFISSSLIQRILTEQQIKQRLQIAYAELKKLDVAKSEFISIASHQLRTPLTAIKGYISMILEKIYGEPPEKMEKPLKNIYASNERLIKLVNDILDVSRIEAGRLEMELEKSSLEEIIDSVIEELKEEAKKKDIYLKFEKLEKPLPKILIDRNKIRQAILNVVDNAIRYTEHGGVTVKIQNPKTKIQIIVSDTGVGMTKYELSKMFESFSRGAAGTRLYTEGVGLGLYIARRLIELHHGKIWAESKGKGKGSTFYIELPIK